VAELMWRWRLQVGQVICPVRHHRKKRKREHKLQQQQQQQQQRPPIPPPALRALSSTLTPGSGPETTMTAGDAAMVVGRSRSNALVLRDLEVPPFLSLSLSFSLFLLGGGGGLSAGTALRTACAAGHDVD
jgi:hypothetical protein